MPSPLFSLIVPTRGDKLLELRLLFESLQDQEERNFECIVVDQSTEGNARLLCSEFSNAMNIRHLTQEGSGTSRAKNLGLQIANGDFICFPDDDCTYPEQLLARVQQVLREEKRYIAICGSSVEGIGSTKSVSRFSPTLQEVTKSNVLLCNIEFATFFRSRAFELVGGFDEEMGVGAKWGADEGPDLLLRLIDAGEVVLYDPTFVAYHPCPFQDYSAKSRSRAFNYGLGRGRLFRKHKFSVRYIFRSLIRAAGGTVVYGVIGMWGRSRYYLAGFAGQLQGLVGKQGRV